jgi:myosin heavy subunit
MVINQLRCTGILEATRIARHAYPHKMKHEAFMRDFNVACRGGTAPHVRNPDHLMRQVAYPVIMCSPAS